MQQTVTLKIKLDVEKDAKKNLSTTMRQYGYACNFISEYVFETHNLSRYDVQKELYNTIRNTYGLRSQMACSAIRTVIAKYKTIKSNRQKWTQPKFRPQLDLVWNKDYTLKNDSFSVNTLEGRKKFKFHNDYYNRYFNENVKFGTTKLVEKNNKFYLHISATYNIDELQFENVSNIVGIDRGIRFLATTYDSKGKTDFYSGKEVKNKRTKYKQLRRSLQQKKTASARRRLKKIGQRENRWMADVNHCLSKALVENNPSGTLFVLEDLTDIRKATVKVKRNNRYEQVSWAYYDLEQKLQYKAERNNQAIIKVNPAYTSQTCPKCGHTERANRNNQTHTFCCKNCGYTSNDDRTAAMNLYRKGLEFLEKLSQEQVSCEQAVVNQPRCNATLNRKEVGESNSRNTTEQLQASAL